MRSGSRSPMYGITWIQIFGKLYQIEERLIEGECTEPGEPPNDSHCSKYFLGQIPYEKSVGRPAATARELLESVRFVKGRAGSTNLDR